MLDRILKDLIRSYGVPVPEILYICCLLRRELLGVASEWAELRGLPTKVLGPSPLQCAGHVHYLCLIPQYIKFISSPRDRTLMLISCILMLFNWFYTLPLDWSLAIFLRPSVSANVAMYLAPIIGVHGRIEPILTLAAGCISSSNMLYSSQHC